MSARTAWEATQALTGALPVDGTPAGLYLGDVSAFGLELEAPAAATLTGGAVELWFQDVATGRWALNADASAALVVGSGTQRQDFGAFTNVVPSKAMWVFPRPVGVMLGGGGGATVVTRMRGEVKR